MAGALNGVEALTLDFAGPYRGDGREYGEREVLLLRSPVPGAHHGLVLGADVVLAEDATSPWRLSAMGEHFAPCVGVTRRIIAREFREECAAGTVHVILTGSPAALRQFGRLFGKQVAIVTLPKEAP